MRLLRMFTENPAAEYTLCHVSCGASGETRVNDAPLALSFSLAGSYGAATVSNSLNIVLPQDFKISHGEFLAFDGGRPLLRWDAEKETFDVCVSGLLSVSAGAEKWRPVKSAVLTVSDKGSRGERKDTAGPALSELLFAQGCVTEASAVVPDDIESIANALCRWCDEGFSLILTTGGTGFSPRDVTPEALASIAEKHVPGFGEMMRLGTLMYTPRSFLTRGLAVIRGKTLIIAFPGSERGARQCFEAIAPGLRHGVEILSGWDAECGGHRH